jgi:hypothetical protein
MYYEVNEDTQKVTELDEWPASHGRPGGEQLRSLAKGASSRPGSRSRRR